MSSYLWGMVLNEMHSLIHSANRGDRHWCSLFESWGKDTDILSVMDDWAQELITGTLILEPIQFHNTLLCKIRLHTVDRFFFHFPNNVREQVIIMGWNVHWKTQRDDRFGLAAESQDEYRKWMKLWAVRKCWATQQHQAAAPVTLRKAEVTQHTLDSEDQVRQTSYPHEV